MFDRNQSTFVVKSNVFYLCHSDTRLTGLFSLTAKFEVGCSADDGAAAVDGQTLIRARVSIRLRAADHQAASHQGVAQVQTQWDFCAVHEPSARQRAGLSDKKQKIMNKTDD